MKAALCIAIAFSSLIPSKEVLAGLIRMTPNDVLEIEFHMPGPPTLILNSEGDLVPPDLLHFSLSNTSQLNIESPVGDHTSALFDGNTLLGSMTTGLGGDRLGPSNLGSEGWHTEDSLYREVNFPVRDMVIDFSSILNGTIDGLIQFTIEMGSFTFDPATLDVRIVLGLGAGIGVWAVATDTDIVISRVGLSSIPEPSALALIGIGLVGIGYGRYRRKRAKLR